MAWLSVEPDSRVTLRLLEGAVHEHSTHWVDKTSKECSGAGCVYCRSGSKARVRYFTNVQMGSDTYTWEFPGNVLEQLTNLLGSADKREGATIKLFRSGAGLNTRYVIEGAVAASAAPAPASKAPAGDEWDVADAVWSVVGSSQFLEVLGLLIESRCKKAIVEDKETLKAIANVVGTRVMVALGDAGLVPESEAVAPAPAPAPAVPESATVPS